MIPQQGFNENQGNPDTGLCFQCRTYKFVVDISNPDGKNVCNQCYDKYKQLCKENKISFVEVPGRIAKPMYGHLYTITDVYGIVNDVECHLGGYYPIKMDYNFPNHEMAKLFGRKMRFLHTKGMYICFYSGFGGSDPIEFLEMIKKAKDNFGGSYDCGLSKMSECWELHGNLERVSCAFSFRIFSKEYAEKLAKALEDPYFENIEIDLEGKQKL